MPLGSTGGDPVQLRPDQINSNQINSTQTRSTQSVVSLGLKHNRRGTHTRSCPSVAQGVTRFNSNQINSKCCLPRFETQPARNTHPVMSLGSTGGDPVQLKPDQLNSNQINSKCCLPRFETQPAHNTHPVMSLGSTGGDPVQLRPDQINNNCAFKVLFLCCNANNHRYLEVSLSTQVCKLIIIQYIYICSNKFQGSSSGTYHTGRQPLQQTLRGVNPYNTPGHVPR
jgi:phosphotransferase system HPr-like phosphotransfer protein